MKDLPPRDAYAAHELELAAGAGQVAVSRRLDAAWPWRSISVCC